MEHNMTELRYKEIISVEDGSRLGYVGDLAIDMDNGKIIALIILGRTRFFGLLGREQSRYIPWGAIHRFGEDIILVGESTLGLEQK
ncbi:MAG: YlmC/YmxH family sporulation protein [Eubacteriales bacterium]